MSCSKILSYKNQPIQDEYQLIGKGGFGRVFKVFNHLDDKYYAIKQIKVSEENITNALTEIRILASISHHHIIRYHHSWVSSTACPEMLMEEEEEEEEDNLLVPTDQHFYFFNIQMEYCHSTLRKYLLERKVLDVSECSTIIYQIIEGLSFLHENLIIHCDLKPDNVLISSFQPFHIKITDFGLARKFTSLYSQQQDYYYTSSSSSSSYIECCLYTAPEQLEKKYVYASDIYSLGVIMMEVQHLFQTEMERILCIQDLKTRRKLSCLYFNNLILNMTDPDYQNRPTLAMIKTQYFFRNTDPIIICRDIVWNIVNSILDKVVEPFPPQY